MSQNKKPKSKKKSGAQGGLVYTRAPRAGEAVAGVLADPPQTLDDISLRLHEEGAAYTLLSSRCTTSTEFDAKYVLTYGLNWAIPHVTINGTEYSVDDRGTLVKLERTSVTFRNLLNDDIILHANSPVASRHAMTKIFARFSGFSRAGAKADDIMLKPRQTATFSIDWQKIPEELIYLLNTQGNRDWLCTCTFSVEIPNVNTATGARHNANADVLAIAPKCTYVARKSTPNVPALSTLVNQGRENFDLQDLSGTDRVNGFDSLFAVDPVEVVRSNNRAVSDHTILDLGIGFADSYFIGDAMAEGDIMTVKTVMLPESQFTYGLSVRRLGGAERPLELPERQSSMNRVIILANAPVITNNGSVLNVFKWDGSIGYWALHSEDSAELLTFSGAHQIQPRAVMSGMTTGVPLLLVTGVMTKKEREAKIEEMQGKNAAHQPFGAPVQFGTSLKKTTSAWKTLATMRSAPALV